MRTDYSSSYRIHLIPVLAMLVAYAWASWTTGPMTIRTPYPLPTQTIAASETVVPAN